MSRSARGGRAHRTGLRSESLAVWFLRCKGYRILKRRYRTPGGEIDIVARRGGVLVFIEVKARDAGIEMAAAAITDKGMIRMQRAAEYFVLKQEISSAQDLRLDVILITPERLWPMHIKGAIDPLGRN
jgi:putative endonuclease